jgi:AAA domain, putative AbiEii toxin, Type IV TA system/AAA domain
MYIERLHVRNLRLLAEQEFSFLGPDGQPRMWTVIVGENGVCKSTILQAIALAALGPKLATAVAQDAQQFRNVSSSEAAEISAGFRPSDQAPPLDVSLQIQPERHDLVEGQDSEGARRMDDIRGFREPGWFVAGYGVGRFLAQPGEVAAPQDPVVDRVEGLFDLRHKMLGIDFYHVLPVEFITRLWKILMTEPEGQLLPDLTSLAYRIGLKQPSPVRASLRSSADIPVQWLSDGYKAMLAWIADLLGHVFLDAKEKENLDPSEFQGIVLLDEIDLHLHPTWQRRIVPTLKRAFPKLQFIVTTHSPLVLAGFEKEEIIRLRFQDGLVVQDPAGIEPGVLTASELLTNFFEVPRAGRPDLVQKERRYLELKALEVRDSAQEEELKALEAELQPYWSSKPEPEKKPLSPQELVGSELP